jgi:uncharacterized membrane protein YjjP (DUF1212 family)
MYNPTEEKFDDICRFIIKLGKAAHGYGSPAIRLESYLNRVTKVFGLEGQFHATPINMVFAFKKDEGDWQRINLTSVSGGLDLTKLPMLDEIVDEIVAGNLSISEAESRMNEVDKAADPYGNLVVGLGYVALGAGIAGLFSGSWLDIIFSALLSLVVYVMVWQGGRKGGWVADLIPLSTALVAGVLATVLKHVFPELNYVLVTLSAIIVLVPGYSVSMGIAEIVNNHVVSGLTNLVNGLVYLFKQFIGAWLAFSIVNAIWVMPTTAGASPVDPTWLWVFVPAIFMGLIIVFQTAPRYVIWAFISCTIGYLGVEFGGDWLGSNMGNLIGAALVGIFANTWEWKMGKPGSIVLLPAITVLVSGSIGFRGLVASAQGQAEGSGQFFSMFLIAITLTAGLVIANTLVKPKKSL